MTSLTSACKGWAGAMCGVDGVASGMVVAAPIGWVWAGTSCDDDGAGLGGVEGRVRAVTMGGGVSTRRWSWSRISEGIGSASRSSVVSSIVGHQVRETYLHPSAVSPPRLKISSRHLERHQTPTGSRCRRIGDGRVPDDRGSHVLSSAKTILRILTLIHCRHGGMVDRGGLTGGWVVTFGRFDEPARSSSPLPGLLTECRPFGAAGGRLTLMSGGPAALVDLREDSASEDIL